MTVSDINTAFDNLLEPGSLAKQRQRRAIGMSGKTAAWYRFQNKHRHLLIDTKITWLKKAGIISGEGQQYNRNDMLEFLQFSRRQDSERSASALGDDYLFEKFLLWKQQGKPAVISTGI